MTGFDPKDHRFMARAIELARRAWGQTRPNPHVGCVIVRDGRIIGEGFHERAGSPHAERNALSACSEDPRGATMYCTLEPCNHHGRTGPCSEAVIAAGISRLVVAQRDPNVEAGGGLGKLRESGIVVEEGLMRAEALLLNPAFNTFHMQGRPLVTLKWAMSLDGCTSCEGGHSAWITGEAARQRAHQMRAEHDAVVVGIETALRDGAKLSIRGMEVPPGPPLKRTVLDAGLRIPTDHPLLRETQGIATIICAEDASIEREKQLVAAGAEVWRIRRARDGRGVSLPDLILHWRGRGVQSIFVEGGRTLAGAMLSTGFVDRVAGFVAPVLIGAGAQSLSALKTDSPIAEMSQARRLHHVSIEQAGGDMLVQGWLSHHLFPGEPS